MISMVRSWSSLVGTGRFVSAQLSHKFGYCPLYMVSIVLLVHKHTSLPLGQIWPFISHKLPCSPVRLLSTQHPRPLTSHQCTDWTLYDHKLWWWSHNDCKIAYIQLYNRSVYNFGFRRLLIKTNYGYIIVEPYLLKVFGPSISYLGNILH